jgi:hypothetical protein
MMGDGSLPSMMGDGSLPSSLGFLNFIDHSVGRRPVREFSGAGRLRNRPSGMST